MLEAIEQERKQIVLNSALEFFGSFKNGYYKKIDLRIKDPVHISLLQNRLGFVYSNNEREEDGDEMRDLIQNKSTPVPISNQTF